MSSKVLCNPNHSIILWIILQGADWVWIKVIRDHSDRVIVMLKSSLQLQALLNKTPKHISYSCGYREAAVWVHPFGSLSLNEPGKVLSLPFLCVPHHRPQPPSQEPAPLKINSERAKATNPGREWGDEGHGQCEWDLHERASSLQGFHGLKEQLSRRMRGRCQEEGKTWRREAEFLCSDHSSHVPGSWAEKHSCFTSAESTATEQAPTEVFSACSDEVFFALVWIQYFL